MRHRRSQNTVDNAFIEGPPVDEVTKDVASPVEPVPTPPSAADPPSMATRAKASLIAPVPVERNLQEQTDAASAGTVAAVDFGGESRLNFVMTK